MNAVALVERDSSTLSLSRWVGGVGIVLAVLVTSVLLSGGPLAAAGVTVLGLFALWLVVDYRAGAIGLMTLSVLVPNGVALYFGPALPLLTFQRAMLVLLVVIIVFHVPARFLAALWVTPHIRVLLGMTLAFGIATALSNDPALSQREFFSERAIGLPLYFAVVWLTLSDEQAVRRLLWAFVAVALVVLTLAVVEAATGRGVVARLALLPPEKLNALGYDAELERRIGLPRVQSVFQHPLQLGAYLVALIPLVVVLRRHAASLWQSGLANLTLILALLALIFTWSRGAGFALVLVVLLYRGGMRRWFLAGAAGAVFVFVWWKLGFLRPSTLVYRWWLIKGVLRAVLDHHGFGTGPGTFAHSVVVRVAETSRKAGVDPLAYSLTMMIEAGVVYVTLLWWFVLGILRDAAHARDHALADGRLETGDVLNALRAGVLANLLLSLFSTSLFGMTVGLFISLMLLAAAVRLSDFELERAGASPQPLPHVSPGRP